MNPRLISLFATLAIIGAVIASLATSTPTVQELIFPEVTEERETISVMELKTKNSALISPGLALVYPIRPHVFLINNNGELVHKWNLKKLQPFRKRRVELFHVELLEDNSILATFRDFGLAKVSWDNSLIWFREGPFHHDSFVSDDGRISALGRRPKAISKGSLKGEVLADLLVELNEEGKIIKERSITDLALSIIPDEKIARGIEHSREHKGTKKAFNNDSAADLLHVNSLEEIKNDIAGVAERGDLLLSLRAINTVMITDRELSEIKWRYSGDLSQQHDATVASDGKILVFDNGRKRKRSRVIKIDPLTDEIVWSYGENPGEEFFSHKRGGAEELDNGNILITISFPGILREVTPKNEIAWQVKARNQYLPNSIYRGRKFTHLGK